MRFASTIALAAAAMTMASLVSSPADAQGRRTYRNADRTESITFIDEQGRRRTKITVRPRSYLDGGTEVRPGERKFFDYAAPVTYMQASPSASWDPTGARRVPLPLPFDLPGYNPYLPY